MITFEEVKEMFKKSIDATDTMNQALENLIQSIYLKGYNEALEQEPKTGHWIIVDDCEKFIAKCSKCGQLKDSRMISKYSYCPNCGAKMEK